MHVVIFGLFLGFCLGQALSLILSPLLTLLNLPLDACNAALFLVSGMIGILSVKRAASAFHLSIPFIKLERREQKKKDLLLDPSSFSDARLIDLANSGLVDHHLVLPAFVLKEFQLQSDKRSLEVVKKLEQMPGLELRIHNADFPEIKDQTGKMVRLARLLEANILAADVSRLQMGAIEGTKIIDLQTLSHALKPLMQMGESIRIKIQRVGKEPRQGVGYLEDGTMVVVNGGGQFIGDAIEARVLSVKHTSSGRMVFCNAKDEMGEISDEG